MRRLAGVFALCLLTLPAICQSTPKYQVATILEVTLHQDESRASETPSYDVSVQVGDVVYVVRYTPHLGESGAKYASGRDILVQVGKTTITYNDIMGRSYEVPIQSQRPAPVPKQHSR
jgi:membrane-bound inhibitor of C-type lysozyme